LFDGLILLNKSSGVTSFEALGPIKKALGSGKVGHTGSLDKFADGLLAILTGKALKLASCFTGCNKHYDALVRFGNETDTLDPEGRVIAEAPIPEKSVLEAALERFRGDIMQTPPVFSAIHVNGKRAHKLARNGVSVEMKPRPVTIHELELTDYSPPFARLGVRCSAGTYVRSLARDIALAAGSRAHLAGLTRTALGTFPLADALSLPPSVKPETVIDALRPIDRSVFAALSILVVDVDEKTALAMRRGIPIAEIAPDEKSGRHVAAFCGDSFIALFRGLSDETAGNRRRYAFVF
jgi:tRNA pseudouridine55 synthase